MRISIPKYVNTAMVQLKSHGFLAYVAGGAIRDALLGKTPQDWDITTNAMVEDIRSLFKKHFDTGAQHGTITVLVDGVPVEITTFRIDGEYEDNRRPKQVKFTGNLSDDLKRRDFTINAMAYNEEEGIIDLFGGVDDIDKKVVRCVGNPIERFTEDALRIMRAVRFSAVLGFDIEQKTLDGIKKCMPLLKNISAERIQTELIKTLLTKIDISPLYKTGVLQQILPGLCDNKDIVNNVEYDKYLRLSALFYGTDNDDCRRMLNNLKFDNLTKKTVLSILSCTQENLPADEKSVRIMLNKYGTDVFEKSLMLQKAIGNDVTKTKLVFNKVKNDPISIDMLAVDGNDIKSLGYDGAKIGQVMKKLMFAVLSDPKLNTRQTLMDMANDLKVAK